MTELDKTIEDWREHGTPRPWITYQRNGSSHIHFISKPNRAMPLARTEPMPIKYQCEEWRASNAGFIAAAPAMADEIGRLKSRIAELEAKLSNAMEALRLIDETISWE